MELTSLNIRLDRINRAKQYALYVSLASIFMMFSALISAYIVRQSAGNWLEFPLPDAFYWSTGIIVASSITLHIAKRCFLSSNFVLYRLLLVLSLVLGVLFVYMQYSGWLSMTGNGVFLDGNPSGSFVYVISGLHAAHVLGGIAAILLAVLQSMVFKDKVDQSRLVRLNLTTRYWHFVDLLWLYLFIFLLVTR